jgi:rod shape-determining protein MreD
MLIPYLLALPILILVLILQTVIVSTLPLLSGYADLILLVLVAWSLQERARSAWVWAIVGGTLVSVVSAAPMGASLAGYLIVTVIARLLVRRVWQTPVLSMFLMTFLGSLITQGLSMVALIFNGAPLPLMDSLNLVVLPSTLLNLLLALPVYAIVSDMAQWVYPEEVEA